MDAEKVKELLDTPETIEALQRANLRALLEQIQRGEGEQIATRRLVGDTVSLLMADIGARQELLQELQKRQMSLSTMQNYMAKMKAAHEAKTAGDKTE